MSKRNTRKRIVLMVCIGVVMMAVGLLTGCPAPIPEVPPAYLLQWGTNGSGDGQFSDLTQPGVFHKTPTDVVADTAGNIYVTDTGANRVQKFSGTGAFIAKWGFYGTADGQFKYPRGIAVDTAGNVYVTDTDNNRIQKFSSAGLFLAKWGGLGNADGQFDQPRGITVDTAGNVYVVDSNNNRIQKFSGTGAFLGKWGSLGNASSGTASDGQFFHPYDIAVDSTGNVYVTDSYNDRIQKFSSAGVFLTKWGSYWNGVGPGDGKFYEPRGITVDSASNVFVSDSNNNRIQKFNSAGAFLVKWGTLGTGNGQFDHPLGIAVDATGNVYVADTDNIRIQKFGKSTSPVKVPVDLGEATLVPDDKKPAPLLPGTIIVNAAVNGSPMILNTGTVTFTLTGPQQTYTGHATQTYLNMPVGNYTIGSIIGGPPGTTLFNITPSPTQTLATGDTITFTLNFTTETIGWCCRLYTPTYGAVLQATQAQCAQAGGTWFATQTQAAAVCQPSPLGWCCKDGIISQSTQADCAKNGGTWYATQAQAIEGCRPLVGWCCKDGVISQSTQADCTKNGGTWYATQAQAIEGCRPLVGWCCKDGIISQTTQTDCAKNGGTWYATQAQAIEGCRRR